MAYRYFCSIDTSTPCPVQVLELSDSPGGSAGLIAAALETALGDAPKAGPTASKAMRAASARIARTLTLIDISLLMVSLLSLCRAL